MDDQAIFFGRVDIEALFKGSPRENEYTNSEQGGVYL